MTKNGVLDARGLPLWSLPANASIRQDRAWRRAMIEWVAAYLDREHDDEIVRANARATDRAPHELNLELALTSAHCGDYELLRKLCPHLAEHLNPPRLKRGQKRKRWTSLSSVDLAAQDVRKVRSLFQKAYGRRRRSRGDWSVEAIVAAVYNIYFLSRGEAKFTEDAIMARLKPSGKHKTPRRKARGK